MRTIFFAVALFLSLSLSLPEMPDRAAGLLERQKDRQKPREREKILIAALTQLCYMQVNKCRGAKNS